MVTKLKNISLSKKFKISLFLLIVILITFLSGLFYSSIQTADYPSALLQDNYFASYDFAEDVQTIASDTFNERPSLSPYISYYYRYNTVEKGNPELAVNFPPNDTFINLIYQDGILQQVGGSPDLSQYYYPYFGIDDFYDNPDNVLYISINPLYFERAQQAWSLSHSFLTQRFIIGLIILLLILLLLILLTIATGKSPGTKEIKLTILDSFWTELTLLCLILGPSFYLIFIDYFLYLSPFISNDMLVIQVLLVLISSSLSVFTGIFYLSLVRKIKSKTFIKTTLSYKLFKKSSKWIKEFLKKILKQTAELKVLKDASPTDQLHYREIIFTISSAVLVLLGIMLFLIGSFLFIFPLFLEALLIYWFFHGNTQVYQAIENNYDIAVEERLKSERMKVELITNISHDLKTPLTSIISYVNLLAKDESIQDSSRDYIEILEKKSDKLKNIVTDLFDLSKSSSGNLNLNAETLDLKKLLEQSLASIQDEIDQSSLDFKIRLPESPVFIESDGQHLSRVFQNLLDNILNYALPQTRVFISLEIKNTSAYITMKNTSAREITYSSEEILQRFTRGDQARESEGSGLGLSIADSFTHACGGNFSLAIDGDLFKTSLVFQTISPS